jgi:hypothetical protein
LHSLSVSYERVIFQEEVEKKALDTLITAPLYLIAALVWILILGIGDPRFQGQGVLGLMVFGVLGTAFAFLRLILGFILFFSLRRR